jgi:hypothetical protein
MTFSSTRYFVLNERSVTVVSIVSVSETHSMYGFLRSGVSDTGLVTPLLRRSLQTQSNFEPDKSSAASSWRRATFI